MKAWTLRSALTALMLGIIVSTFFILATGILLYRLPQISQASHDVAQREASDIAYLLEYQLDGIRSQLQPTAAFLRKPHSQQEIEAHLDAIVGDGVVIEAIYVVNLNGSIETVGLPPVRQHRRKDLSIGDFSANRLFQHVIANSDTAWSDKYLSAMTGSFTIGIAMSADDKVIVAEVAPQTMFETVRAIARRTDHPVMVVDSRGEWIADNTRQSEARLHNWAGHPAVKAALEAETPPDSALLDGREVRTGHDVSPHLGWAIVVGVPTGMDNPEIRNTVYLVIGSFLAAVLIGLVTVPVLIAQYDRPLRSLFDRTNRLARGDYSPGETSPGRIHELNQLLQDMEHMAHAIRERQDEISHTTRRLEESGQDLLSIFNASPVAMSITDARQNYGIVNVNAAWEKQFGRSRKTVRGLNGAQIGLWAHPEDRIAFRERLEADGAVDGCEVWCLRSDGSRLLCKVSGRMVQSGERHLVIMVQEDVTERRRNEERIQELNAELETRVLERTQDLEHANRELSDTLSDLQTMQQELVNAEKLAALGRLVAGIAHELNTPIGNGLMAATTFRDQLVALRQNLGHNKIPAEYAALLADADTAIGIVTRNLERSAQLIASFKRTAVDQTTDPRRRFLLKDMVDEVLAVLQPTLRQAPVDIATDIPADIELDSFPGSLEQVLANLINNAVLHAFENRERGRIELTADAVGDDAVLIRVADDGTGIPGELQKHVFTPFFTTKLGRGGSGLGLHIVHSAVTSVLGGRIAFTSSRDDGTLFEIKLPRVAPERPSAT